MPRIELPEDMSDISEMKDGFDPVPDGTYAAKLIKAEPGVSSNNNPMIKVRWEVIEGEHEGRIVFDNIMLMKTAEWKLKQYTNMAGIESGREFDTSELEGLEAILTVTVDDSGDTPRSQIKSMQPMS